jgi:carboxyl-terminal processing protease
MEAADMEKKHTLRSILLGVVALVLLVCAYGGGVATGYFMPDRSAKQAVSSPTEVTAGTGSTDTGTPTDLAILFKPFWEAWDYAHQYYVDQPVDDTKLMEGAIQGMLTALGDPHTGYSSPQVTEDENALLSGKYEGIGAWVDTRNDYLTIVSPMSGSPAEKAGLQAGDKIIAVDGTDMTGVDPEAVRQKVLGPAGSSVTLTIQRDGVDQPFDVTVTRANIVVPSVESKMLDNNIAYVKISIFSDNTATDLHDQLQTLMAQNPKGLIIDLRNNGGGLLTAAVSVASEFLDKGVVLYERDSSNNLTEHDVVSGGLATNIPLVVLVNGGTASASEIVSGAIQDYGRGQLVGVTTYGKGSVQQYIPLSDGGTARITVAKWLTPNQHSIDGKGLTPDVVVEQIQSDINAGLDPQLDAAIQLLSK